MNRTKSDKEIMESLKNTVVKIFEEHYGMITEAKKMYALIYNYEDYEEFVEGIFTNKNAAMKNAESAKIKKYTEGATVALVEFPEGETPSSIGKNTKLLKMYYPKVRESYEMVSEAKKLYALVTNYADYDEIVDAVFMDKKAAIKYAESMKGKGELTLVEFPDGETPTGIVTSKNSKLTKVIGTYK